MSVHSIHLQLVCESRHTLAGVYKMMDVTTRLYAPPQNSCRHTRGGVCRCAVQWYVLHLIIGSQQPPTTVHIVRGTSKAFTSTGGRGRAAGKLAVSNSGRRRSQYLPDARTRNANLRNTLFSYQGSRMHYLLSRLDDRDVICVVEHMLLRRATRIEQQRNRTAEG